MEDRSKILAVLIAAIVVVSAVVIPLCRTDDDGDVSLKYAGPLSAEDKHYDSYTVATSTWNAQLESTTGVLSSSESTATDMAKSITSLYMTENKLMYQYRWMQIDYYKNPTSKADEYVGWATFANGAVDGLYSCIKNALKGDTASTLEEALALCGLDPETFRNYNEMTDEQAQLLNEISELVSEYETILSTMTSDMTYSTNTTARKVAEIYIDLVEKRNSLAKLYGYENYADYAYELNFGRGYTPDDIRGALSSTTMAGLNIYSMASQTYRMTDHYLSNIDDTKAKSLTSQFVGSFDKEMKALWNHMQDYELMNRGGEGAMQGGFTAPMQNHNAAIYLGPDRTGISYTEALVHEFGHASNMSLTETYTTDYDVCEIQSIGLESMYCAYAYKNKISDMDEVISYGLNSISLNIWSGAFYTEFELAAYESTETLTVDGLAQSFENLKSKYGLEGFSGGDLQWIMVNHLFQTPHYYISYAVAGVSAMQLFVMAIEDFDAAKSTYLGIVHMGRVGYTDVISSSNLSSFLKESERESLLEQEKSVAASILFELLIMG